MIGKEIDARYRIEAELGQGGAGTVYRAVHVAARRPVAMKVLKREFGASAELRKRFERETRALSALAHPNIVAVEDSGITGDTPYLVMELLSGETLAERLRRGRLAPAEAFEVERQLLRALAFVHEKGLLHRDVKPANVFLSPDAGGPPRVRLLDFGLAKFTTPEGTGDRALTRAGQVFGTPAYMAPEQIAGQEADARADVYAAGTILFEMLAGEPPFRGQTSEVLRRQVMDDLPLDELPPGTVSPAVLDVLRKATAKTRAQRFQNGGEMLAAFEEAAGPAPKSVALDPTVEQDASLPELIPLPEAAPLPEILPVPHVGARMMRSLGQLLNVLVVTISLGALGAAAAAVYVLVTPERAKERLLLESVLGAPSGSAAAVSSAGPAPSGRRPGTPAPKAALSPPPSSPSSPSSPPVPPSSAAPSDVALAPSAAVVPGVPSDPWVTVPQELARYVAKVNRGRALEKRELAQVHRFNGKNPTDPRGHLVLARSHMRRRWARDAASEFAIAYKIDPASRGDPHMLRDLLAMTQLGASEAATLVVLAYGKEALPAIDESLAAAANRAPEVRARLEKLREAAAQ